jgi:Transposase IS66 family
MRVGELLRPITAAMGQELLKGDYIQADETPVDVRMHDGRGKNQALVNGIPWRWADQRFAIVEKRRRVTVIQRGGQIASRDRVKRKRGAESGSCLSTVQATNDS